MPFKETLNEQEKILVQRHLREGEEVGTIYKKVRYNLAEERTLGKAVFDTMVMRRSKAKGKGKIFGILETFRAGKLSRIIFLNKKYDALKLEVHFSQAVKNPGYKGPSYNGNTRPMTASAHLSGSLPCSITVNPELVYAATREHILRTEENAERTGTKEGRKEFLKSQMKLARKEAKQEKKHPSARGMDTWFEIKDMEMDKKLIRGECVSLLMVVDSPAQLAKLNITSIEQIRESMGAAAKGKGTTASGIAIGSTDTGGTATAPVSMSVTRPFRLDLFMEEYTDEFYATIRSSTFMETKTAA